MFGQTIDKQTYKKGRKIYVFLQKKKTTGTVVFFKYRPCMRVGPVFVVENIVFEPMTSCMPCKRKKAAHRHGCRTADIPKDALMPLSGTLKTFPGPLRLPLIIDSQHITGMVAQEILSLIHI